jgi:hypothetical protein
MNQCVLLACLGKVNARRSLPDWWDSRNFRGALALPCRNAGTTSAKSGRNPCVLKK